MSINPNVPANPVEVPGLGPAAAPAALPPTRRRYALGLPAGSVRGILALMVLGLLWAAALLYQPKDDKEQGILLLYVQLQYLMVLILAHFFTAHGHSIGSQADEKSPLGLPAGSIRILLVVGFVGLAVWVHFNKREFEEPLRAPGYLPLILLAGYLLGYLMSRIVNGLSGGQTPFWYQDIEAWVALLAMFGLTFELLYYLFIWGTLSPENRPNLGQFESGLAAVVGFYFGARS
jgi:hypothetical protein